MPLMKAACGRRFCDLASSTPPTSILFPPFFISAAHACAQTVPNTDVVVLDARVTACVMR